MAEDLSVDAAVSLLGASETATDQTQQDEPIEASSTEAETVSEEETPGDDETVETETEAEAEPVEAPTWWTPEDKAKFAQLPPELRATVLENEGKRETLSQKARQEAAETKKVFDQRAQELLQVAQHAAQVLPKAINDFQSRWGHIDWQAENQRVNAGEISRDDYRAARDQFEIERDEVLRADNAARRTAHEAKKLADEKFETEIAELAPALRDPKTGAASTRDLNDYMVKNGIPAAVVNDLDAHAVGLFWKAFQFDRAQEALKSRPKPAPIPQKGNVAPAATPQRTSQQRSVEQLSARLSKTGDVDDGVALLRAQRRA